MTLETIRERISRCEHRVKARPVSAAAHYNLGLAYQKRGYVKRAAEEFQRAVELKPECVEAWVNLGGARLLQWDFQGALEATRRAVQLKDDLPVAHYNLGQAYLYLGDAKGLVRANRRVLELDPDNGAAHYYLAVGLLALDEVEASRLELAHAMALGHRPVPEFLKKLHEEENRREAHASRRQPDGRTLPRRSRED